MKLKEYWIDVAELQEYLDKYEDKIKFIIYHKEYISNINAGVRLILVIDES